MLQTREPGRTVADGVGWELGSGVVGYRGRGTYLGHRPPTGRSVKGNNGKTSFLLLRNVFLLTSYGKRSFHRSFPQMFPLLSPSPVGLCRQTHGAGLGAGATAPALPDHPGALGSRGSAQPGGQMSGVQSAYPDSLHTCVQSPLATAITKPSLTYHTVRAPRPPKRVRTYGDGSKQVALEERPLAWVSRQV